MNEKAAKKEGKKASKKKKSEAKGRSRSVAAQTSGEELAVQEKRELQTSEEEQQPGRYYTPYTDIYETPESLMVVMEMPGVDREHLEVTLERNVLTVEGRIDFSKYADLRPVYTEYNVGNYSRSFRLTGPFDPDRITAQLADGVLVLELEREEKAKPRRIAVE